MWRDGGDCLIFDAGPVGADHLPAHAHADLLTIEASLAGRRLIVDTGVFNYEDDAMRRLCRGTAAHNVLQVDGQDHCDMWSRFRMGRRGKPQELAIGVSAGFHWARASHNAYRRLRVSRVTRWIACRAGGPWICLDAAQGQGVRQLTSWLHLAPGTEIEVAGPWTVKLRHADAVYELNFLAPGELRVTQGWHCPRFGVRQEAPVLQWSTQARLPQIAGWFLRWQGEGEAILDHTGHLPTLIWSEEGREVRLASLNL